MVETPILDRFKKVPIARGAQQPTAGEWIREQVIPSIEAGKRRGRTQLMIIGGPPGSGKTRAAEELRGLFNTQVSFDEDGRDPAKEAGVVGTDRSQVRSTIELETMSNFFEASIIQAVLDPEVESVLAEMLVTTQAKVGRRYRGDNIGSRAFYMWTNRRLLNDVWSMVNDDNLAHYLPDYDLYLLDVMAGPTTHQAVRELRTDVKNAEGPLEAAVKAAKYNPRFIGLEFSDDPWESFQRLKRVGARPETRDAILRGMEQTISSTPQLSAWREKVRNQRSQWGVSISTPEIEAEMLTELTMATFIPESLEGNRFIKQENIYTSVNELKPEEIWASAA